MTAHIAITLISIAVIINTIHIIRVRKRVKKMEIYQLKRIADSLMMIEITLLKSKDLKYTDVQEYAKDYNKASEIVTESMEHEDKSE